MMIMRMASAKRWRHWADGEGSDSAPEDLLTETPTSYELRQSNRSSNNRQKDALRAVSVARALPPLGPGYHHIAISTAAFRADQPLFPLQHRRLGVITSSHRGVGLGLQLRRWVLGRAPCQRLLHLGAVAEARHLVANWRPASIPLPAIRQYADAQLIVFLVVDDGASDQYDLPAALRGEAHPVAGIKGRLLTLAHFCVSMMERGLPHPPANLR